ncbi:hypothetical protein [Micromonospora aurantiaca]|uniref:hypothetical protein n=1 Tax=Micromonospora aurantiaca (nom. illeg.) TaxID=47850 RepID=UPI0037F16EE3
MVLIGALLGGAVAFVGLLSIRAGLAEQTGVPVDLVVPWSVVGGVVGLCLLLAVLASALPTWRSLGRRTARSVGPGRIATPPQSRRGDGGQFGAGGLTGAQAVSASFALASDGSRLSGLTPRPLRQVR